MRAAVAAVVGGDDQMVRPLRRLRHPADALPRAPEGVQIVRAHPAPVVAGAVGEAQIQETDLAPTVCALMGLPAARDWEGTSLI